MIPIERLSKRTPIFRLHDLIIAILLCASATVAQAQDHQLSAAKRTRIERAVSKFMASTHVPGVSVAVVESSE